LSCLLAYLVTLGTCEQRLRPLDSTVEAESFSSSRAVAGHHQVFILPQHGSLIAHPAPILQRFCSKESFLQVTWMVCRKFQFQVFNYLDENGKGTLKEDEAVQCTRSTAFVVSDHLAQLLINDGMSREGTAALHLLYLIGLCACF
jgi:hypothetical protein